MREYRNRICAAALAVVTMVGALFVPSDTVRAEGEADQLAAQKQAAYDAAPETNSLENWPQGPHVYANSAIVMDMNSKAVLYGKKVDDKHYPASITKLLTALVALENSKLDDEVYFSEASVSFLEYGDASIGMRPGEILSMKDALYGMLLASANEVSYAIAESVGKKMGGGFDTFIQEMNDRSKEIGCTGSHWTNANGLHDDEHYTTAHDMALIGAAVYQFEEFRTVMQTLNYTIAPTNLVNESRTFQQNHKMLWEGAQYSYDFCTGGKTGYTDQAKTTLVTMADNGDMQLVAVVLEDQGDVYVDTRAMFDYVYGNFSKVSLKGEEKPEGVRSFKEEDAYVVLPAGIDLSMVKHEIEITDKQSASGKVTYLYKGQNVGSAEVKLTADYIKEETGYNIKPELKTSGEKGADAQEIKKGLTDPVKLLIGVGALIIVLIAALFGLLKYRQIKRRKARALAGRRRQAAHSRAVSERSKSSSGQAAHSRAVSERSKNSSGQALHRRRATDGRQMKNGQNRNFSHTRDRDGRYR